MTDEGKRVPGRREKRVVKEQEDGGSLKADSLAVVAGREQDGCRVRWAWLRLERCGWMHLLCAVCIRVN